VDRVAIGPWQAGRRTVKQASPLIVEEQDRSPHIGIGSGLDREKKPIQNVFKRVALVGVGSDLTLKRVEGMSEVRGKRHYSIT
jgi:hypothetical protein